MYEPETLFEVRTVKNIWQPQISERITQHIKLYEIAIEGRKSKNSSRTVEKVYVSSCRSLIEKCKLISYHQ